MVLVSLTCTITPILPDDSDTPWTLGRVFQLISTAGASHLSCGSLIGPHGGKIRGVLYTFWRILTIKLHHDTSTNSVLIEPKDCDHVYRIFWLYCFILQTYGSIWLSGRAKWPYGPPKSRGLESSDIRHGDMALGLDFGWCSTDLGSSFLLVGDDFTHWV